MKLPKISVITPSYDQGKYLKACLSSVLDQDYPELEIVVIDGGSQDNSLEIIRSYESQLTSWVSEPDFGQADAINKGFRRTEGELVTWLNADDFYLPGALRRVADAYLRNPAASFYFGDGLRVDENGKTIGSFFPSGQVLFDQQALDYGLNYILQPAAFVNRKFTEQDQFVDPNLQYGLDTDLWIRLAKLSAPQPIPLKLAATREYEETKTSTGSFARIEELRQIAEKHTGLSITPGVILYFLDELFRHANEHEDIFPGSYHRDIVDFWLSTQDLLVRFLARPDGFPIILDAEANRLQSLPIPSSPKMRPAAKSMPDLKIGIDTRQLSVGPSGGIAQWVGSIARTLFYQYPNHSYYLFTTVFNRKLIPDIPNFVELITLPTSGYFAHLDSQAEKINLDVLIRSYPIEDDLTFPHSRQVIFMPDIQQESFPDFFSPEVLRSRRAAFNRALSYGGAIITLSEYTRESILSSPWQRCDDIVIAGAALPVEFGEKATRELSEIEQSQVPEDDFFLYPANLWPHKNHRNVLQAFRRFLDTSGQSMQFVFTGYKEGWDEISADFGDLPIQHLGFVSPELLHALYKRAKALVFFSLHEGFGIPLLEAFSSGTPVICSNSTSLPEIGGDAVLVCDPVDVPAMSELMRRIVSDSELRDELVRNGTKRLQAYRWTDSARIVIEACQRVAEKNAATPVRSRHSWESEDLPLVSIVTPSYNQAQFLRATIESVLNQSYPNIEYFVVDGDSTDMTLEILESYGDRIRWIAEPDAGQANAINKGFALARGEIRSYLNSDDILAPDAVEFAVQYLQEHPSSDLVYGSAYYIDEVGEVTGSYNTAPYTLARLLLDNCICQPATFWRSRIAKIVGPLDERLIFALDYDYWIRIAQAGGKIDYVEQYLASWRIHPDIKTLSDRRAIYKEIFDICLKHVNRISLCYLHGYWHHRIWEQGRGWPTMLRRIPRSQGIMARTHALWIDLQQGLVGPRFAFRLRQLMSSAPILRTLSEWASPHIPLVNKRRRVYGFTADSWLGPTVQVWKKDIHPDETMEIRAYSPKEMNVKIYLDGRLAADHKFEAGKMSNFTFHLDFAPSDRPIVTLRFSDFIRGPQNQKRSLLLEHTNLFTELDTVLQP